MKSAHVYTRGARDIEVRLNDIPIPVPLADQVLIKVVVAGTNPKDWKYLVQFNGRQGENTGDDVAGYVEGVGSNVTEFKVGDRVAAFHEMTTPHGAFAEYAIAWEKTTFHLPKQTTFEEAATIPLAAMTASM
jgi:NADPH:quinone reductase-like Zn-dependent oxidoreductase